MNRIYVNPLAADDAARAETADAGAMPEADTPLTYGELLSYVKERRSRDLEAAKPNHENNQVRVAQTVGALTGFMRALDLEDGDLVGEELVGTTAWDSAAKRVDSRRRSELNTKVRPWAMEVIRTRESRYDDETFGERLRRLREAAGISKHALHKDVAPKRKKPDGIIIRDWESGKYFPGANSDRILNRMAHRLGVPVDYLEEKLPQTRRQSRSIKTGLSESAQRRLSQHLPADFDSRSDDDKEAILAWVRANILTAPKEELEGEGDDVGGSKEKIYVYALTRSDSGRGIRAPDNLIEEINDIVAFKTSPLAPLEYTRNEPWSDITADKSEHMILSLFGAMVEEDFPMPLVSLSAILSPTFIERYIKWRVARRGGYTASLTRLMELLAGLVHPKYGYIAQNPGFGLPVRAVPGFITEKEASRISSDWRKAVKKSHKYLTKRSKEIEEVAAPGRDPFQAILPAVDDPYPLGVYYQIVDEIRGRIPPKTYGARRAEAFRSLMLVRIGLETCLRQKNLRQMLVCLPGDTPRPDKYLSRKMRPEIHLDHEGKWVVRVPRSALKNSSSSALRDAVMIPIALSDRRGLYCDIANYLECREVLVGDKDDPGTFFVKSANSKSDSLEYESRSYYEAYRAVIASYGIYNPFTRRGAIAGLLPHGPHSARHIMATTAIKGPGGISAAAALLLDTEETVRKSYARFLPHDRHAQASARVWGEMDLGRGAS